MSERDGDREGQTECVVAERRGGVRESEYGSVVARHGAADRWLPGSRYWRG